MTEAFTALVEREGDGYVALRPELDVASQGSSAEEARGEPAGSNPAIPPSGQPG